MMTLRFAITTANRLPKLLKPTKTWTHVMECCASTSSVQTEVLKTDEENKLKSRFRGGLIPVSKRSPDGTVPIEVQSLIRGMINNKLLATSIIFPEFDDIESLHSLKEFTGICNQAIDDTFDADKMWHTRQRPEETLQQLKGIGLNSIMLPKEYGGLGLDMKNWVFLNDFLGSKDLSIWANVTTANDFGSFLIARYGSSEQKEKYLPLIAQNKLNVAYALQEPEAGYDMSQMRTHVNVTANNLYGDIELSGIKTRVPNAHSADLFLVWANVHNIDLNNEDVTDKELASVLHNVMLVERTPENEDKIKILERNDTSGLPGLEFCTVEFDRIRLNGRTDILGGDAGSGFEIGMQLFENTSLSLAAAVCGACKTLINEYCTYANKKTRYETILSNISSIRTKISDLCTDLFALEALTYYTAGHLDESADKIMDLEHLVLQVESMKLLRRTILGSIELIGADSLSKMGSRYERMLKDTITLASTNLYVSEDFAINGIAMGMLGAWADKNMSELIKKRQNPHSPLFRIKNELKFMRAYTYPKLSLHIHENVHPSLANAATILERQMGRVEVVTNRLISDSGRFIEYQHEQLRRLATCGACLSLVVASISRASRAYAIGVGHGECETQMAHLVTLKMMKKIDHMLEELFDESGQCTMSDFLADKMADYHLERSNYAFLCPLEKNW